MPPTRRRARPTDERRTHPSPKPVTTVTARALRDAPVAVLGARSWGTALAIQFARGGRPTRLWGRNPDLLRDIARERRNARYLPGAGFPESLTVAPDLQGALGGAVDVLVAVPSHAFRALLREIAPHLDPTARV